MMALMRADMDEKVVDGEAQFERDLFVHDRALWTSVYQTPEEAELEHDVEWVGRDSPEEFRELMDELQAMGLLV